MFGPNYHFHRRGGSPRRRFKEIIQEVDFVYEWDFWWVNAYLDGRQSMVLLPAWCELEYALP
jgi:hypothetical protein